MSVVPLSLYIHFPWCIKKCPYCDFNSHTLKHDLPEEKYIHALLNDLTQDLAWVQNRKITSIFMGGGTPSLFSPEAIQLLLTEIRARIDFANDNIEITLEANPGTVDEARFAGFRQAGVNRLSIGIQSFDAEKLKTLGRIHDGQMAQSAVMAAKAAGFTNFNLDLMHGLPNQTKEQALHDLQIAVGFLPPHLSWYQLTLEPNTLFYQKPPVLPPEDILYEISEHGAEYLKNNHYQHYEVSAYCKAKHECQHNLNYWQFGDYLGIGAGAHGKITDVDGQQVYRYWKIKHPKDYLEANNVVAEKTLVAKSQLPFEFMLNALRLQKPIENKLFTERTFLAVNDIASKLEIARDKKLLTYDEHSFAPTLLGRRFLNDLLTVFI